MSVRTPEGLNLIDDLSALILCDMLLEGRRELLTEVGVAHKHIRFAIELERRALIRAAAGLPKGTDPVDCHDRGMEDAARICDDMAAKAGAAGWSVWFRHAAEAIRAHKARPAAGGAA